MRITWANVSNVMMITVSNALPLPSKHSEMKIYKHVSSIAAETRSFFFLI